jgi:lysophospholipase L1-like esterase
MSRGLTKLFPAACLLAAAMTAQQPGDHWVGTWASSQQRGDSGNAPPEPGFTDTTLRQIAHVSIGGSRIRVRFSNEFGNTPLKILSAHVAVSAGGAAIRPETDRALAFHGSASVAIPTGAPIWSDPLDFPLGPLSDLAVSIYLKGAPPEFTTHPGARAPSFFKAGDLASAPDLNDAARTEHWYFLSGVDVMAPNSAAAVVTLGDSITDGRNATNNGRWPDGLARRLQASRTTAAIGVLNAGIGGNCLLYGGLGPNALARLDRDVLSQSGVRWLIVLEGINDLGSKVPASSEDLIAAYQQIIERAHSHGIRVFGATIMPVAESFYFKPELESKRQAINSWIRTSGGFDAVIDLDAATRDPERHDHLAPAADSGDHLHPANPGYQMMADAIDLKLFTPASPPAPRQR